MVRTQHEEDEVDDYEISSRTPDSSSQKVKVEGKRANAVRSKHSETEQRRRSKINERFQILRELIPESDQKRDKASFLLEVIQYIQFLQGKIQMYEGTYHGWSAEPSKLMPWRRAPGQVADFVEHSGSIRNGSNHEDNIVINSALPGSTQTSVEPELSSAALYEATDDPHMSVNEAMPFNVSLQPDLFENVTVEPYRGSSNAEQLIPHSPSLYWSSEVDATEPAIPSYGRNDQEELKVDCGEAGISTAVSQRLLNTLNQTLASMGVDMSQANLQVQLDIGKHTNKRVRTEDR